MTEFLRINFLCVITMIIFLETSRLKFVKKRICRKKKKGTKSRRNEEKKNTKKQEQKSKHEEDEQTENSKNPTNCHARGGWGVRSWKKGRRENREGSGGAGREEWEGRRGGRQLGPKLAESRLGSLECGHDSLLADHRPSHCPPPSLQ